MLAEIIAPTVDTLTWEEAIAFGSQAWESAEQSKWDLGDIGAIVAHKWQDDSVKKFAESIGMHDNPRRLYEYVQVATHYPKSARALFPKATWSAWRECSRHGLTPAQSMEMMEQHSEKAVAAIRRAITGNPPRPNVTRVEFEATLDEVDDNYDDYLTIVLRNDVDANKLQAILEAHPDATITVTVTYAARPAADGTKGD